MGSKLCFFNSTKAWGGGEKWHLEVATAMHQMGHSVILVTSSKSQLHSRAVENGIPLYQISVGNISFLNPWKILKTFFFFRKFQVDTVVMNLPADLKLAGIAAKLAGVKRIIYRRGSAIPIKSSFLNRFLFGKVVTEIIANSEETKLTILKNNPNLFDVSKIHVLYNGIDLVEYDNRPFNLVYQRQGSEVIIGNAGRLVYQKGQDMLLEAAAMLDARGVNFKLLIAGDGKLRQELEQQAIHLNIAHRVFFLGFVDNIKSFMESIDIFVLPSRWEGFGYVLAEAMASRKPIVAFNVSSNPELVEDGVTGTLVPMASVKGLAESLLTLAAAPTTCMEYGDAGRAAVELKFNFDANIKQIADFVG